MKRDEECVKMTFVSKKISFLISKSPRYGKCVVVLPRYNENMMPARKGKTLTEDVFEYSAAKQVRGDCLEVEGRPATV